MAPGLLARRAVRLLRVAACALAVARTTSSGEARAAEPSVWTLGIDAAYGPRFEIDQRAPKGASASRNDVGRGGSVGLTFGRIFSNGVPLFAVARMPLLLEGQGAIGAGLGFEGGLPRSPIRLFGGVQGGYAALFNNACECGRLTYEGAWARAEAGVRHRIIEHYPPGIADRHGALSAFDIYVSATVALDVVAARYPDMSQYGSHLDDRGVRWGVDPSLGAGFVW